MNKVAIYFYHNPETDQTIDIEFQEINSLGLSDLLSAFSFSNESEDDATLLAIRNQFPDLSTPAYHFFVLDPDSVTEEGDGQIYYATSLFGPQSRAAILQEYRALVNAELTIENGILSLEYQDFLPASFGIGDDPGNRGDFPEWMWWLLGGAGILTMGSSKGIVGKIFGASLTGIGAYGLRRTFNKK